MLTISGANWFSRRGGTCRLHAIYEPTVYLYGESGRNCQVRLGAPSSPGNSRPTQERDGRPIAMYHYLSTLGEMRLYFPFLEIEMAKSNLSSMSVAELLKLRDDIGNGLSSKANELKNKLARLGNQIWPRMR